MRIREITEAPETNKTAGASPNQYSVDAKGNYTPLNKAPQPKVGDDLVNKFKSFFTTKSSSSGQMDRNKRNKPNVQVAKPNDQKGTLPNPDATNQKIKNFALKNIAGPKIQNKFAGIDGGVQPKATPNPNRFAGIDGGVQPKATPKQFKKLDQLQPLGPGDKDAKKFFVAKPDVIPPQNKKDTPSTPTPRPKSIKPSAPKKQGRVTYRTLAKLSGIKDPNKIFPGQKVTLPGGGSYTIKKGDTLSGIAQTYRLAQQAKRNNPKVEV
jgi:LysM repeat protein